MATSFKVPKSPTKSIFEIDDFLGVDLTNNGTNIEEHRSPNATNMVRYVPGKVRKRTGYHTEIVFGNGLNTNLAIGADDKEYVVEIVSDNKTKLYDLYIPKDADKDMTCYYEFDYISEGKFWLPYAGWIDASPNEYTHYKKSVEAPQGTGMSNVSIISASEFPTQIVTFKKFSFMYNQDENYRWKPAPKYFVYRETNDPVYGCHRIKHGTFDGNRVVNVNRAKGTSNEYATYNLTSSAVPLFELCEAIEPLRTVYVDFDYKTSSEDCKVLLANSHTIPKSVDGAHFSFSDQITNENLVATSLQFYASNPSSIEIKNVSVVYEKNENYKWSLTPEEKGSEFHIEDLFVINIENYASIDEFSGNYDADGTSKTVRVNIAKPNTPNGSTFLSFSLYATIRRTLNSLRIRVITNDNSIAWEKTYTGDFATTQFDLYLPSGRTRYPNSIEVTFNYPSITYEIPCWVSIKNVKINPLSIAESYNVSSIYSIYHVGSDMYLKRNNDNVFENICTYANPSRSKSWQIGDNLLILDGKNVFKYAVGSKTVSSVNDGIGYIPLVTIGKSPQGGGTPYEDLNLLQPGFYETFYVSSEDANKTMFFLSFRDLDNKAIKVWTLSSIGTWVEKTEGVDFHAYRGGGYISFIQAPGTSPLTGEDNVKVLAYRTVPGYKERITNCTIGTLFGVNGASDRLFLSGNPDYPNYDWYSEQYDLTYFPDTGYSTLGLSSSAIVGYAIVNNYLATFKDEYEPSQSVYIREGDTITDETTKILRPAFKLINSLQGNGVIAPDSFGYLQTEPLFLTRSGIFSITPQDITGEKYAQSRSFYLDGALTKEPGLEKAYATVFNDMYILALNNKFYILDGLQATRTDKSEPYATRQYVGFVCADIPANCLWEDKQALYFGSYDGHVCVFATDTDDLESYNDDGLPIYCCWETPDLDGQLFYKNKSFRYIAIRMMAALKTSAKLWAMARGAWSFIKEDNTTGIFFDFENVDFEAFSFSTDRSDKVAHSKIRVKKVDKARFKIENDKLNEPFGLLNLALEYVESGNYKG